MAEECMTRHKKQRQRRTRTASFEDLSSIDDESIPEVKISTSATAHCVKDTLDKEEEIQIEERMDISTNQIIESSSGNNNSAYSAEADAEAYLAYLSRLPSVPDTSLSGEEEEDEPEVESEPDHETKPEQIEHEDSGEDTLTVEVESVTDTKSDAASISPNISKESQELLATSPVQCPPATKSPALECVNQATISTRDLIRRIEFQNQYYSMKEAIEFISIHHQEKQEHVQLSYDYDVLRALIDDEYAAKRIDEKFRNEDLEQQVLINSHITSMNWNSSKDKPQETNRLEQQQQLSTSTVSAPSAQSTKPPTIGILEMMASIPGLEELVSDIKKSTTWFDEDTSTWRPFTEAPPQMPQGNQVSLRLKPGLEKLGMLSLPPIPIPMSITFTPDGLMYQDAEVRTLGQTNSRPVRRSNAAQNLWAEVTFKFRSAWNAVRSFKRRVSRVFRRNRSRGNNGTGSPRLRPNIGEPSSISDRNADLQPEVALQQRQPPEFHPGSAGSNLNQSEGRSLQLSVVEILSVQQRPRPPPASGKSKCPGGSSTKANKEAARGKSKKLKPKNSALYHSTLLPFM